MTRARVRRRRLVSATLLTAAIGLWAGQAGGAGATDLRPVARDHVVVHAGDTLWSIAERIAPGEDPRPLVDAISTVNGVDAAGLVPGQTLVIPADTG